MTGNTFGKIFTLTSFGESHGTVIGVVIDGCLPNMLVDLELIKNDLNRRRPGQSNITTSRGEPDEFEIISGVFEGKTLGTPIAVLVKNKDQKPEDYSELKDLYRPSHADFTYQEKYGHRDYRGGGRQSARETIARVIAGAFAKMILSQIDIQIKAYVSQVYDIKLDIPYTQLDLDQTEKSIIRCPEPKTAALMIAAIEKAKAEGDSLGGVITCICNGVPIGLGEPVFDKLHADLGKAMLSINAVKGFDFGSGFASVLKKGSEHNDRFIQKGAKMGTETNHSGGIQGGISNGEDIYFNVAFKPVATLQIEQDTLNESQQPVKFKATGRHDSCVVPRAVPIVEAMTAIVLADHYLRSLVYKK
ncbi:MAG: chorismate synthase [Bacteroidota bacterium]|nr:chorismate synthase [Bacteroidota bacterium]